MDHLARKLSNLRTRRVSVCVCGGGGGGGVLASCFEAIGSRIVIRWIFACTSM